MTATPKTSTQPHPRASIALLGEALVDHFPDADVIGGAPFNVARNLAALGAAPLLVTRLGNDPDGEALVAEFQRFALSTDGIQRDPTRATGNVRVTFNNGQPQYHIADGQAWDAIDAASASRAIQQAAPTILCFGTLAQRESLSRNAIREVVSTATCQRVLDLNLRNCLDNHAISAWSLEHADIVKLNDEEFLQLLAWFVPSATPPGDWRGDATRSAVANLLQQFGIKQLIVTRGADGYIAYDRVGNILAEGTAPKVAVIDTVGAGDAFLAVTLLGNALGWPLSHTLEHASHFAASVCTLRGAVSTDANFYQTWRERFTTVQPSA